MSRRVSIIAAFGMAGILVGCGLQPDSAPRDIQPADIPSPRDLTAVSGPSTGERAKIFMLTVTDDGVTPVLAPVRRELEATTNARMTALLDGLTADEQTTRRLRSAIPPETRVLQADVRASGLALIDLSKEFVAVSDQVLTEALAQVVFTITELTGVSRVQVLIDGLPHESPRGDGTRTSGPLTTFDFPDLNPSSQPEYPVIPSPTIPETTAPTVPPAPPVPPVPTT
jgi:hypothetical protein